jgi:hypothetical protein
MEGDDDEDSKYWSSVIKDELLEGKNEGMKVEDCFFLTMSLTIQQNRRKIVVPTMHGRRRHWVTFERC